VKPESKLNCLLESEPKLRIAAPALSIYHKLEEILKEKFMVAGEVVVITILILLLKSKRQDIL
jgi:hypothetical protein